MTLRTPVQFGSKMGAICLPNEDTKDMGVKVVCTIVAQVLELKTDSGDEFRSR